MLRRMLIPFAFILIILAGCSIDNPSLDVDKAIENGGAYKENITAIEDKNTKVNSEDEANESQESEVDPVSQELEEIGEEIDEEVGKKQDIKLLSTHEIEAETASFSDDLKAIVDNAHDLGGYVRSNNVAEQPTKGKQLMQSELTLRIPKEKASEMIDFINETVSIIGETVVSVDVSEEYYDIEARIENLESREQRLRELYDRSDDINDIIEIDDKLFEVTEEREKAVQKYLRMQDRISFSRIDLSLIEVKKLAAVQEENLTGFAEIAGAFDSTIKAIGSAIVSILSFIIKAFPILVLLGGGYYLYKRMFNMKNTDREMTPEEYRMNTERALNEMKFSDSTKEEVVKEIKKGNREEQDEIVEQIKKESESRKERLEKGKKDSNSKENE